MTAVPIEKLRELVAEWERSNARRNAQRHFSLWEIATLTTCADQLRALIDAAEAAPHGKVCLRQDATGRYVQSDYCRQLEASMTAPVPPPTEEEIERCSESIWQTIEPGSHLKEQHWTTRELQKDRARACLSQFFAGRGWK